MQEKTDAQRWIEQINFLPGFRKTLKSYFAIIPQITSQIFFYFQYLLML